MLRKLWHLQGKKFFCQLMEALADNKKIRLAQLTEKSIN